MSDFSNIEIVDSVQGVVEIDTSIFGDDLLNEEVLGEPAAGEAARAAEEAARAAAEAAMAQAMVEAKRAPVRPQRKRFCPVVNCPNCAAALCVVQINAQLADGGAPVEPVRKIVPPEPVRKITPNTDTMKKVVGAVAMLQSKVSPLKAAPPKALVRSGNVFSGTCPNCGTNLDLTVAAQIGKKQTDAPTPMTVKQLVGDDVLGGVDDLLNSQVIGDEMISGDDVLGEILGDLIGAAPTPGSKPPLPPKPDEQPAWQKYLNLAAGFVPTAVTAITEAAAPGAVKKPPVEEPPPAPPPPKSFLMQDAGPLPVWGWGAIFVVGGGTLFWMMRRKKPS